MTSYDIIDLDEFAVTLHRMDITGSEQEAKRAYGIL
jgi:hypothetical protein